MPLTRETIKHYKSIGHNLNPVVMISENGLSEGVLAELDRALTDHELVKIKVSVADRDARKAMVKTICEQSGAELVQEIGKTALLFRVSDKKNIKTSNIR